MISCTTYDQSVKQRYFLLYRYFMVEAYCRNPFHFSYIQNYLKTDTTKIEPNLFCNSDKERLLEKTEQDHPSIAELQNEHRSTCLPRHDICKYFCRES